MLYNYEIILKWKIILKYVKITCNLKFNDIHCSVVNNCRDI